MKTMWKRKGGEKSNRLLIALNTLGLLYKNNNNSQCLCSVVDLYPRPACLKLFYCSFIPRKDNSHSKL